MSFKFICKITALSSALFANVAFSAECAVPEIKLVKQLVTITLVSNACGYDYQWLNSDGTVLSTSYFPHDWLDSAYTGRAYDGKAPANIYNTSGFQVRAVCMGNAGCPNYEIGAQGADLSGYDLTQFVKIMKRK